MRPDTPFRRPAITRPILFGRYGNLRLNKKILLITISILFVALFLAAYASIVNFRKNYTEALVTGTIGLGHGLNGIITEMVNLGLPIDTLVGMEKKLQQVIADNDYITYAGITDLSGVAIFHSNPELVGKTFTDEYAQKSLAALKPLLQLYHRFDGRTYYDVTIPILDSANTHLGSIRLGFPTEVVDLKVREAIVQLATIFSLVFIIITLFLYTLLSRYVSNPVTRLAEKAQRIAEGRFDGDIEVRSHDEIGLLADSLNKMSGRLKQQLEKLSTARDEMEALVSARTEELNLANAELSQINDALVQAAAQQKLDAEVLAESREQFQTLATNSAAGIFVLRGDKFVFINPAVVQITGYTEQELLSRGFFELAHPDHQQMVKAFAADRQQGKPVPSRYELKLRHKNGETRWVDLVATLVHYQGQVSILGTGFDITQRKRDEANLRLAASVFTHAREGILITLADGTIVDVNETFTQLTGYTRDEVLGKNPRILKSGRHPSDFYNTMWRTLLSQGYWYGEVWNRRKDGELIALIETISAVQDESGNVRNYVSLFSDITSMKEHEQQLEHIAHFDALTNLPNRVLLADRLSQGMLQSQRRSQSLAVLYLDLDGFKAINDQYGHDVGDKLLVSVASRMKSVLREGDTLARIGGDEFIAVLVDLETADDYQPVVSRLLEAASAPMPHETSLLQVSASIGVTLYPHDGVDADQLIRHADQAMYQAKQSGKNRYHLFDIDQDVAVKIQQETIERIHRALDQHEFRLHYQPKVNMLTGEVIGVEALIRWQHPERGLLSPAAFLPSIEEHEISIAVGEWVIDTALTQMSRWKAAGLHIPVSVNIGARQLQDEHFEKRLAELLAAHPDIVPNQLELEILETSALEDITQVSAVMRACRELGVHFALDDFGTGYSSLTYLKRLPADTLKIDQSFVRDMLIDLDDMAIVEGVIGLANAFRRTVIAEGVETIEHGALLLQFHCELAQGYGIAKPMPPEALPNWIDTWKADTAWHHLRVEHNAHEHHSA